MHSLNYSQPPSHLIQLGQQCQYPIPKKSQNVVNYQLQQSIYTGHTPNDYSSPRHTDEDQILANWKSMQNQLREEIRGELSKNWPPQQEANSMFREVLLSYYANPLSSFKFRIPPWTEENQLPQLTQSILKYISNHDEFLKLQERDFPNKLTAAIQKAYRINRENSLTDVINFYINELIPLLSEELPTSLYIKIACAFTSAAQFVVYDLIKKILERKVSLDKWIEFNEEVKKISEDNSFFNDSDMNFCNHIYTDFNFITQFLSYSKKSIITKCINIFLTESNLECCSAFFELFKQYQDDQKFKKACDLEFEKKEKQLIKLVFSEKKYKDLIFPTHIKTPIDSCFDDIFNHIISTNPYFNNENKNQILFENQFLIYSVPEGQKNVSTKLGTLTGIMEDKENFLFYFDLDKGTKLITTPILTNKISKLMNEAFYWSEEKGDFKSLDDLNLDQTLVYYERENQYGFLSLKSLLLFLDNGASILINFLNQQRKKLAPEECLNLYKKALQDITNELNYIKQNSLTIHNNYEKIKAFLDIQILQLHEICHKNI